jgi:hypothetical protein
MIAVRPDDIKGMRPLHAGECLIHPFLGGENEDDHYSQSAGGLFIPLNPGLYPSHARVLATHEDCREAVVGDVVMFPYMAYDWQDVVIQGRNVRVATVHEDKLYGRLQGWDDEC